MTEHYTEPGWYVMWHPTLAALMPFVCWMDADDLCECYSLPKGYYAVKDGWKLYPVPAMTQEIGEPK